MRSSVSSAAAAADSYAQVIGKRSARRYLCASLRESAGEGVQSVNSRNFLELLVPRLSSVYGCVVV
jgi:hypothetical protein